MFTLCTFNSPNCRNPSGAYSRLPTIVSWGLRSQFMVFANGACRMPDLKGVENLQLVIAFIVPGLIITYVRTRFINGRMDKPSEALLGYLALTIVYYDLTLPLLGPTLALPAGLVKTLCWFALL